MSIADKPLDKVEESDLTALISDKEPEGKTPNVEEWPRDRRQTKKKGTTGAQAS